jgi:hypothetical protein
MNVQDANLLASWKVVLESQAQALSLNSRVAELLADMSVRMASLEDATDKILGLIEEAQSQVDDGL